MTLSTERAREVVNAWYYDQTRMKSLNVPERDRDTLVDRLDAFAAEAVREERERCESIVLLQIFRTENMKGHHAQAWSDIATEIAVALREGAK